MSVDTVKSYFSRYHMDDKIIELKDSSATVELAAQALGCEPKRIAKTLSFTVSDQFILIVMAGDAKIDNKKFKDEFHEKAKMIPAEEVEHDIGHAPGGVCPFAVNDGIKVYLDTSLKRFETVFPAAGSSNSAIKLSLPELEHYSNSIKWIDVCKI